MIEVFDSDRREFDPGSGFPPARVFAFGSNLDDGLMRSRIGGDGRLLGTAFLDDFALRFPGGLPAVFPSPGDRVPGTVWEVGPSGLSSLDACEGVPTLYTREVALLTGDVPGMAYYYLAGRDYEGTADSRGGLWNATRDGRIAHGLPALA